MALAGSSVTVTSAVALNTAGGAQRVTVSNGAAVLWLGGSNVDATHGASVAANGTLTVQLAPGEVLFGFCATSTVVGVLVSGV